MLLWVLPACGGGGGDGGGSTPPASTYTVTYHGNGSTGGSVPSDTTNYTDGQTVTVAGNTGSLVKTGFTFSGWNTKADGSGTPYTQGQTFTMGSASITLYAVWVPESTEPEPAEIGKWDASKWDEPDWGP